MKLLIFCCALVIFNSICFTNADMFDCSSDQRIENGHQQIQQIVQHYINQQARYINRTVKQQIKYLAQHAKQELKHINKNIMEQIKATHGKFKFNEYLPFLFNKIKENVEQYAEHILQEVQRINQHMNQTIQKQINLMNTDMGSDQNWSNLSKEINEQVQNQVNQINQNVETHLRNMNQNLDTQMNNLDNHISKITDSVYDLNTKIQQNIQKNMEPVYAMNIRSQMAKGVGGITGAVYGGKLKVLYKNGVKHKCTGDITGDSVDNIKCSQPLTEDFTSEENICTESSQTIMNNMYCFGDFISMNCINGKCKCSGGQMYTLDGLKKMCGSTYGTNNYVKYVYYPDKSNRHHVGIPNPNKHVTCEENSETKCTWNGTAGY